MIKIAICDDDENFCKQEQDTIIQIMKLEFAEIDYELICCNSGQDLKELLDNVVIDVVFLDIELGSEDGFQIANEMRKKYEKLSIIFVTTYENLVYDSFEYRPLGFVRKRLFSKEFRLAMIRVIKQLTINNTIIVMGELKRKKMFMVNDVCMIQNFRHDVIVSTFAEDVQIRDKISNHIDELISGGFVEINRGVVVNMKHIDKIDKHNLILSNKKSMAISRNYYQNFIDKYERFKLKNNS